tara:strand:+ start:740 stop:967 length:228 start_codon:yes stop_codon:yes gene_type:complete
MEAILGPVIAVLFSVGYTETKLRKHRSAHKAHQEEYKALVERVDVMERNLGRNMLSAMIPLSKSVKELQETVGLR